VISQSEPSGSGNFLPGSDPSHGEPHGPGCRIPYRIPFRCKSRASSSQSADSSLADLHAWQASPAGLAAAQIFSLVSTISDLNKLATSPLGCRLLFSELPGLKSAATEIDQLLSRIYGARGMRR
jgi:hypothetical protein